MAITSALLAALVFSSVAPAAPGASSSGLKKCKGDAAGIKLQVQRIGCDKAFTLSQNSYDDCSGQPFPGSECKSKVSGFSCVHRGSKNADGVGTLIKSKCTKKVRKGKKRVKQMFRWETVFAG